MEKYNENNFKNGKLTETKVIHKEENSNKN